jgi:hypothetical protein
MIDTWLTLRKDNNASDSPLVKSASALSVKLYLSIYRDLFVIKDPYVDHHELHSLNCLLFRHPRRTQKNTIHNDAKDMSSDKRINKRVPGFDTFYSLNEPQIGSTFSSVR